ncbi:uncharacterized protein [Amphiura filiformis]|uniref:uncharacterized protein n=1 Tax=Amphiura filiformis TaxID=82378 RepID=UPI003B2255B4
MTKNIHSFVKDNFGRECLQDVRSYEKTARKIANYRNHLRFNLRCLHEHITPRSIKLKSNVSGHKADTILENAERKLLNERVRQVNFTIDVLNRKKDQLSEKLSGSLSSDAYNRVAEFTTHAQLSQHEQGKRRHLEKFRKLQTSRADLDKDWRNSGNIGDNSSAEKWVKNLSDRQLSNHEVSVLAKGLNYAVVPEKVPAAEIVTVAESAVSLAHLKPSDADSLRHKICQTLCNTKLPQSNITKDERKALSDLTKDDNIVVVPADKGKCVVVLNESDYDDKCNDLLKDKKTYKPVGYNPTSGYRKRVTDFTNKITTDGSIDIVLKRQLDPPLSLWYRRFTGFKIHKPDPIPVRPIVSSIGSVTYNLAKHAAKILGPLVGRSPHHIKNTQDFVNQIKDLKLSESEIITSYDVTALFTCIPPDFALNVVKECLESDNTLSERTNLKVEQIVELVEICLNTTYFSYKGKYFKQQHGCAMGSPVSPIVVNLCMESFEQQALKSYPGTKPRFGSHHPLVHKLGVIRTLQYRADTIISDSEQVPEEKDHIKTALNNCGYPDWAFLKATKSKEPKTGGASGQTNRARVTIPYISGISERVKNHFKSFGISTSFKPVNTLRGKPVNVKDKQPKDKRSNLVYGVVCGDTDCSAAYVGETKQALKPALVNIGDQVPTKRKTLLEWCSAVLCSYEAGNIADNGWTESLELRWLEKVMPDDMQELFIDHECEDFVGNSDESDTED